MRYSPSEKQTHHLMLEQGSAMEDAETDQHARPED